MVRKASIKSNKTKLTDELINKIQTTKEEVSKKNEILKDIILIEDKEPVSEKDFKKNKIAPITKPKKQTVSAHYQKKIERMAEKIKACKIKEQKRLTEKEEKQKLRELRQKSIYKIKAGDMWNDIGIIDEKNKKPLPTLDVINPAAHPVYHPIKGYRGIC